MDSARRVTPACSTAGDRPLHRYAGAVQWGAVILVGVVAAAYAVGTVALRRSTTRRIPTPAQIAAFLAGVAALGIALSPWVDGLASTDLAAHMAQHVLLWLVAAPLLVLGAPLRPLAWSLGRPGRRSARLFPRWVWRARAAAGTAWGLAAVWAISTATLWAWHLPPLYEAAVRSPALHALEHAAFLGTAILFWWALTAARRGAGEGAALLCLILSSGQSAALGALLTFSGSPWYPDYPSLERQQLAGLVMWIPGSVTYLVAAAVLFLRWLDRSEAAAQRSV
jgi:putative membrane protein